MRMSIISRYSYIYILFSQSLGQYHADMLAASISSLRVCCVALVFVDCQAGNL